MVVILIVQGSDGTHQVNNSVSPNFDGSKLSNASNSRGDRLSTATNTTSVSIFSSSSSSLPVDAENLVATAKEEEWIRKKRVELTTKRHIETRVKRQVVLEDGKVVEDSGPIVTTNTSEDTEKQEHEQIEHRQIGDDSTEEGLVAVPNSSGLVKEVRENKVKSWEETEELVETEDIQHLGDITDDAYLKAIQSQRKDLRLALRLASSELLFPSAPSDRIVNQTLKNRKVVDSENTKHLSEVRSDGRLITETTKTNEHEEITNTAVPNDDEDDSDNFDTHRKSSQRFRKTKDQELVEYFSDDVKIGEEIKFEAENVESVQRGNPECLKLDSLVGDSLSERIRKVHKKQQKLEEADRMDALTKKPVNFDQEEETRIVETSKWLEHHFGSESYSSPSSVDNEENTRNTNTNNFINVTMTSIKSPSQQPKKALYKGISEWNDDTNRRLIKNGISNRNSKVRLPNKNIHDVQTGNAKEISAEDYSHFTFQPMKDDNNFPERVTSPVSSPISELDSSPLYASIQRKYNNLLENSPSSDISSLPSPNTINFKNNTRPEGTFKRTSPIDQYDNAYDENKNFRVARQSRIVKQRWNESAGSKLSDIDDSDIRTEPDPDYSPRLHKKILSAPDIGSIISTDTDGKQIHHKTRFSAEIPFIRQKRTTFAESHQDRKLSSLGDKFRKMIGKLQNSSSVSNSSSSDNKKTISNGLTKHATNPIVHSSKTANHFDTSYHTPGHEVNNDASIDGDSINNSDMHKEHKLHKNIPVVEYGSSYKEAERIKQKSPTSLKCNNSILTNGSQSLDRYNCHSRSYQGSTNRRSPTQKYYLGEDPFKGSIYGKEEEYDRMRVLKKNHKSGSSTDDEKRSVRDHLINGVHILGCKLSKSINKLKSHSNENMKKENQTLTRKSEKQVFLRNSNSTSSFKSKENKPIRSLKSAQTCQSPLLRSKSLNSELLGPSYKHERNSFMHNSNPQLHKWNNEPPPPLKSPSIVTNIHRNSCDLRESMDNDCIEVNNYAFDSGIRTPLKKMRIQTPGFYQQSHENGEYDDVFDTEIISSSTPIRSNHKYTTNYNRSNSFHSDSKPISFKSNLNSPQNESHNVVTRYRQLPKLNGNDKSRSISKNKISDDYSETVHITSKSNNPLKPSVTHTVQNFSKKTLPSKDGRSKIIETSEITKVTKSHSSIGESITDIKNKYRN